MTVEKLEVGKRYRVNKQVPTLCCAFFLPVGNVIKVQSIPTPNRAMLLVTEGAWKGTLHKVRKSTLRMAVEEVA